MLIVANAGVINRTTTRGNNTFLILQLLPFLLFFFAD